MNTTWIKLVSVGAAAALVAIGCTVTSDDGTDAGSTGGTAGSGTGGTGGGTGGTGGGTGGTGGTAGGSTGGTAGTTSTGGTGGTGPASCNPADYPGQDCQICMVTQCCAEYQACTDNCATELPCIQDYLLNPPDGGTLSVEAAAGYCQVGTTIADTTNALVSCLINGGADAATSCSAICFNL